MRLTEEAATQNQKIATELKGHCHHVITTIDFSPPVLISLDLEFPFPQFHKYSLAHFVGSHNKHFPTQICA